MKRKIVLKLTVTELEDLLFLVKKSGFDDLIDLVRLVMDQNDHVELVRIRVYEALSDLSGFEPDEIQDSDSLKTDLGFNNYLKKSLKVYFNGILLELGSDQSIFVHECEELLKVSDCINLVISKL